MKKYTTIDLFAGAGGLSYGFQETGKFDVKIAIEHNKYAQKTYKKNHPGAEIESDITQITNDKYKSIKEKCGGHVDIIIGGPPCQGFSNANRQKNELICGNNQLVNEYIRAVEQLEPRAFVMENVKMISSSKHKFFCNEQDKRIVEKLGVHLQKEIITIAEATICTDEFIGFLKRENVLKEYLLERQDYNKINTIYRNTKKSEQLKEYFKKHEDSIEKLLKNWDSLKVKFWNKDYEQIFIETKNRLKTFVTSYSEFDKLRNSLKMIIETQKAIYKMKEIRDYRISLLGMTSEKNNICIIVNTYNIIEYAIKKFESMGYIVDRGVLNAVNYGVPQSRERFIMIGVKKEFLKSDRVELPKPILESSEEFYTIRDAIEDLEKYQTSVVLDAKPSEKDANMVIKLNPLQRYLNKGNKVYNHIITDSRETALERFKHLQPGQNFHNLSENLKTTYSDPERTQNTIYLRLNYETPSGTVLNARKSMWIHPKINRAISIREVARLQSFPDTFVFEGTKDSQYQQIGNAVPPLLGRAIAEKLLELIGDEPNDKLIDIIVEK